MSDNWMFVGAAFGVTWAAIIGYLVHLQRTLRRARTLFESATGAGRR